MKKIQLLQILKQLLDMNALEIKLDELAYREEIVGNIETKNNLFSNGNL